MVRINRLYPQYTPFISRLWPIDPNHSDPARQHTKAEFQNIKGISKYFPLWHVDGHVSPSPKAAASGRARRAGIEPGTRGLQAQRAFRHATPAQPKRRPPANLEEALTPALQFFCFWHVEGALLARRRTLGPALQFFCFPFFSRSKEQFWHVDGHWDQPYSFSVFLFLARRRGAFGTSTDIGTMPYSFSVFCFSKEHCWRVDGHWDQPYSFSVFLFLARRRGAIGTSTDIGTSLTVFLFFCFWHVEGALLARRRTLGPCLTVFLLSVFRRSTVGTSTDIGTSLTVFLFFCFWHVEGALLARRRSAFGTSTDIGTSLTVFLFFCFWHVEGALLARRRTLGPALQFFCFPFFSRSKEQFWHVDGHWDQPYSFFCFSVFGTSKGRFWHVDGHMGPCLTVFLSSVFRRSTVGTSTDIGTSLTVFLFFCFWHVEGALLARRRTLGPCLTVFLFSVFRRSTVGTSTDIGTSLTVFLFFCFWHVEGALLARRRTLGLALYSFSVFLFLARRLKGRFWHVDGHWEHALQFFCFVCFWHVEGALLARRRSAFGTSTDIGTSLTVFLFFGFWHVEGALLARRRTLQPALQFFCFPFFSRSKEQFWHVDGHWDQPYSFSVFLFLARRRGA